MAFRKIVEQGSSSRPTKKQKSPPPIMAPMHMRVYDSNVGSPPQRLEPLQTAISTESSSFDSETTL